MKLSYEQSQRILEELKKKYVIYAPKAYENEGRYSYTDSVRYGAIEEISEIVYKAKAQYSIKEVLLPINHTVGLKVNGEFIQVNEPESKPMMVFIRPCDKHAIERLDKTFEKDGYYQNRRKGMKFVMMDCNGGWDTCFCTSVGTNVNENYDLGVKFFEDGIAFEVKDKEMEEYFEGFNKANDFKVEFVSVNEMQVRIPMLRDWDWQTMAKIKDLPLWENYAKRCIGCGSCNMACSTCTCLQEKEVSCSTTSEIKEVKRVWNGCQLVMPKALEKNTLPNIVPTRIRQRIMDKFYRPNLKESKEIVCVGCGRCIDVCPKFINFGETVNSFCEELDHLYEISGATNEE